MGVFYETIPETLAPWVLKQRMFWVATAPLSGAGHVNVSPKGGEYFGLLDNKTFWFMELTGSGCETLSHLHEPGNGRITIMFSAFEGAPKIVRFWGKGRVLENKTQEFESFVAAHNVKTIPGTRSIILVDIHQAGSSCGYSVPFYDFKAHRDTLNGYFRKKEQKFINGNDKESMDLYWAENSQYSMDGLPGMKRALAIGQRENVDQMKKMVGPLAPTNAHQRGRGQATGTLALVFASFIFGILFAVFTGLIQDFPKRLEDLVSNGNLHSSIRWT